MRVGFLILLPVVLCAQDPDDVSRSPQLSAAEQLGGAQFAQTCGFCHGRDARGASGPDLIRSSLVSHDIGGDLIGPVIRNGRPQKGMPAFQLSDAEIKNIAAYLHAQARVAASVAQRIPSEYPLSKLLVGNATEGKLFFEGPGKCVGCHSTRGDLQHIASKYKPFDLQTKIAFPSGAKPTVVVTDGSGRIYSGEQIYSDEFSITLRDSDGWQRSWDRRTVKLEFHNPLATHEKLLQQYTDAELHNVFAYLETLK